VRPAVHDGEVYVGSHDSNAYAIDLQTGEKLWSTATGGWITGSAVATNDHVLVGSYDAKLYALDRDDGSVTWTAEGRGDVTSAPIVTDDGSTTRSAPAGLRRGRDVLQAGRERVTEHLTPAPLRPPPTHRSG